MDRLQVLRKSPKLAPMLGELINGNGAKARKMLKAAQSTDLSEVEKQYCLDLAKVICEKQGESIQIENDFVKEILSVYQAYWVEMYTSKTSLEAGEGRLRQDLNRLVMRFKIAKRSFRSLDKLEQCLAKAVKKRGYYCSFSLIRPFRDVLVWKEEKTKPFSVLLPEQGRVTTQVKTLDKFISLGWMHFVTQGVYYVGGWAMKDHLVRIKPAFRNERNEDFRCSFLTHETQHFVDYKSFPKLLQADLEYRAKLAELSSVRKGKDVLMARLFSQGVRGSKNPHPLSNYVVVKHVAEAVKVKNVTGFWQTVTPKEINIVASELLVKHSEELRKLGAKSCKGVLGSGVFK
ncbi:MAG: hypothetical protein AB7T49_13150 [Oligoflexales bacterium]